MKYIDADKLIAEIRELRSESCISESDEYYEIAKSEIIDIITSLQQEQPEVDLEKEITPSLVENMLCEFGVQSIEDVDSECLADIARHFYELGLNARKEE